MGGAMKKFKPTDKQRFSVSVMAGFDMSEEEMARALNIPKEVLCASFKFELTVGSCQRRQELLEATYKRAMDGNIDAVKTYLRLVPKVKDTRKNHHSKRGKKNERVGKKVQAKKDATTAQKGTKWEKLLDAPSS